MKLDQQPEEGHADLDEVPSTSTEKWIDLKIGTLRSEMRLLFVVSVAGNQLLQHLTIGTTVATIGNVLVFGSVAVKYALLHRGI